MPESVAQQRSKTSYLFICAFALVTLGAIATVAFMVYAASPWSSDQPFGLAHIAFILWAITPYSVGAGVAWLFRHQSRSLVALVIGFAISVGSAAFIYYDSLFVHIDAQGALIFVFFPLYQLAFTLILAALAAVCRTSRADAA